MLGGSTKHFKTYGKRKVNVVNKRVVLGETTFDNNNNNNNNNNSHKRGNFTGWSDDSSSSESESEVEVVKRSSTVGKKNSKVSQNKENLTTSSSTSTTSTSSSSSSSTTTKKKPVNSVKSSTKSVEVLTFEETSEESDRKLRVPFRRRKPDAGGGGAYQSRSRFARVVESEDEKEDSDQAQVVAVKEPETVEEITLLEDHEQPELALYEEEEEEEKQDLSSLLSEVESEDPTPIIREERPSPAFSSLPFPSILSPLLASTLSPDAPKPYDFTSFVSSPLSPFSTPSTAETPWTKIGEASYSEVFSTFSTVRGEEIVVKIIPVASKDSNMVNDDDEDEIETAEGRGRKDQEVTPDCSDWESVKREIEISKWLGGDDQERQVKGFVRFRGAFLVQGLYPTSLLSAWDTFKSRQRPPCQDQIRPCSLPRSQLYALILLDHAGNDLESWKMRNWRESKEIWDQVVRQLGDAEKEFQFEHRDLHWGNILIAPVQPPPSPIRTLPDQFASMQLTQSRKQNKTDDSMTSSSSSSSSNSTVKATLIDFTLSRMIRPTSETETRSSRPRSKVKKSSNDVLFDPFEDDCIFQGEGDLQFDVYRGMRTIVEREGGGWEGFHPKTNLLWLHYVVNKLLYSKKLKIPSLPPPPTTTSNSTLSSPGRAVPSPRKTRRHSLLFPSNSGSSFSPLPSSPLATTHKSRTLPSSSSTSLLSRQQQRMTLSDRQRKEMNEEVQAWESLKKAEIKLKEVLGDLLLSEDGAGLKPRVRKTTKSRGKVVKKVEKDDEEETLKGAKEFADWWGREVSRLHE